MRATPSHHNIDNIPHRQRLPPTADVRRAVLSPFVLIVLLIVCLFTSPGCRRDTPEADSNAKDSLTIAMVEPSTIDPSRLADSPGRKIASNLFVGLTALNDKAEVIPGCSDTWKSSDDARRWEFAVRGDMRWSDGTPITAHTFREAWLRATHPKTENPMAEMFDFIQGAAKRRAGDLQAKFGVIAEESDLKVTIHTVRPMPDLPRRLAQPWAAPVPMHVISKHGQRWTSPKHIVVNGPYALSAHRPGTSMTFVRNTSSRVAATIGTVHTLFTDSPLDAQRWFELKKVDWADNLVPKDAIASLRQQKNSPLQTTPYLGLTYIIPNHARPAMDLAFRRALNLSIDRRRLVKHVLDGSQLPLSRPIPRSLLESPLALGMSRHSVDGYLRRHQRRELPQSNFRFITADETQNSPQHYSVSGKRPLE